MLTIYKIQELFNEAKSTEYLDKKYKLLLEIMRELQIINACLVKADLIDAQDLSMMNMNTINQGDKIEDTMKSLESKIQYLKSKEFLTKIKNKRKLGWFACGNFYLLVDTTGVFLMNRSKNLFHIAIASMRKETTLVNEIIEFIDKSCEESTPEVRSEIVKEVLSKILSSLLIRRN